jgi:hypothetical protein
MDVCKYVMCDGACMHVGQYTLTSLPITDLLHLCYGCSRTNSCPPFGLGQVLQGGCKALYLIQAFTKGVHPVQCAGVS